MSFEIVPNYRRSTYSLPNDVVVTDNEVRSSHLYSNKSALKAGYGLIYSTDLGTSWQDLSIPTQVFHPTLFAVSRTPKTYTAGQPVSGTTNTVGVGYIYANSDGTFTWNTCASFPNATNVFAIACSYDGAGVMVVGLDSGITSTAGESLYIYYSSNSGQSWTRTATPVGTTFSSFVTFGKLSYFKDLNGNSIWLYSDQSGIVRSIDSGQTWTRVHSIGLTGEVKLFRNYVVGCQSSGIVYSTDYGLTWTQKGIDINASFSSIAFSSRTGQMIAVSYHGNNPSNVWQSPGGKAWQANIDSITSWTSLPQSYIDTVYTDISTISYVNSTSLQSGKFVVCSARGTVWTANENDTMTSGGFVKQTNTIYPGNFIGAHSSSYYLRNRNVYGNDGYGNYPTDIVSGTDWEKIDTSAFGVAAYDDEVFTPTFNIGFDWGWNGSTYNTFKMSSNGVMQFSAFSGGYANETLRLAGTQGIRAHNGDLWYRNGVSNSVYAYRESLHLQTYPDGSSVVEVSVNDLSVIHNIDISASSTHITLNKSNRNDSPGTQFKIHGVVAGGAYVYILNSSGYQQSAEGALYSGGPSVKIPLVVTSQITAVLVSKLNPIPTLFRNKASQLSTGMYHSMWRKNISWVDNGVTHNILRLVVYCGAYAQENVESGYRISLYKAGASQKFSVSLIPTARARVAPSYLGVGPLPHIFATSPSPLEAPNSHYETTWSSDDNGLTWSIPKQRSTVVQMGPAVSNSGGLSLLTTLRELRSNRVIQYSATYAPDSIAVSSSYETYVGENLGAMLLNFNVGNTAQNSYEQTLYDIFNTQYSIRSGGSKKNPTYRYIYYSDITDSGGIGDVADAIDLNKLAAGLTPNDTDSYVGADRLLNQMRSKSDSFVSYAISQKWLKYTPKYVSSIFDASLPGVRTMPVTKQNVGIGAALGLGPIDKTDLSSVASSYTFAPDSYTYVGDVIGFNCPTKTIEDTDTN